MGAGGLCDFIKNRFIESSCKKELGQRLFQSMKTKPSTWILAGLILIVVIIASQNTPEIQTPKREALDLSKLQLTIQSLEPLSSGRYVMVSGKVQNNSGQPAKYIRVRLEVLDKSGRIVGTYFTYAVSSEPISSGSSQPWSKLIPIPENFRDLDAYVVSAR